MTSEVTQSTPTKYRYVDTREPWQIREKLIETGWEQKALHCGDFLFQSTDYKKVIVTRKTTMDMLSSLNKNFSQQLEAILETADICVLLIENPWQWTNTGQMLTARGLERHVKKEVLNFIHRWQAKGFILERTANWEDTVQRLNELYALYQKPYSLSARSKGYADERLLALPSGLRGKAGEALLDSRSLKDIANMTLGQILSAKIDGIGRKRAELCYNHFNREADNG